MVALDGFGGTMTREATVTLPVTRNDRPGRATSVAPPSATSVATSASPVAPPHPAPAVDRQAAMDAVAALLTALGRRPAGPHLADTPRRVVDAYLELLTPARLRLTTFPNDEDFHDLVLLRDVPFRSVCAHHLLPFTGVAHLGYVPGDRIVGLSKLARVVHHVAADLQLQERITNQVVELLTARLAPRAVGVVLEADHLCVSVRGIRAAGARTVTTAFSGTFRDDAAARQQFLALAVPRP